MQLIATYLAESEQRIEEPSVQHDVLQLGEHLIRTGIRAEDRPNDGLRVFNDIDIGHHAHSADQSVDAHYRGSLCLVTHEGVHIEL